MLQTDGLKEKQNSMASTGAPQSGEGGHTTSTSYDWSSVKFEKPKESVEQNHLFKQELQNKTSYAFSPKKSFNTFFFNSAK